MAKQWEMMHTAHRHTQTHTPPMDGCSFTEYKILSKQMKYSLNYVPLTLKQTMFFMLSLYRCRSFARVDFLSPYSLSSPSPVSSLFFTLFVYAMFFFSVRVLMVLVSSLLLFSIAKSKHTKKQMNLSRPLRWWELNANTFDQICMCCAHWAHHPTFVIQHQCQVAKKYTNVVILFHIYMHTYEYEFIHSFVTNLWSSCRIRWAPNRQKQKKLQKNGNKTKQIY